MTVLPDPRLAHQRFSDHYRANLAHLGEHDIVVASNGGAGQSLIGNILFELGLNYVDAYTEVLTTDGHATAADGHDSYRSHLAALHDKDAAGAPVPLRGVWPRFVKTHHPPLIFDTATIGGVWVLVRDPRDALYSLYQWRHGFAEEDWDRVPGTFLEWVSGPGDFSRDPVTDWSAFYFAWLERAEAYQHSAVIRFEDLKTRPVETLEPLLGSLGLSFTPTELQTAVEASSFTRMREHEDRVTAAGSPQTSAPAPRMIRAGSTEGWKEWMTPELLRCFSTAELRSAAELFGYHVPEVE